MTTSPPTSRFRRILADLRVRAGAAIAGIALLAALIGDIDAVSARFEKWLGRNDESIRIKQARLLAFPARAPLPAERDQFFLQVRLLNLGEQPLQLTSARIRLRDAGGAHVGTAGSQGRCVLSPDSGANPPVILPPGKEGWVELTPAVALPGLDAWLDRLDPRQVMPMEGGLPSVHELRWVASLNAEIAHRFGDRAALEVTLHGGVGERRRRFRLALAQGKDLFAHDGSLAHDALLASALLRGRRVFSADCTPMP